MTIIPFHITPCHHCHRHSPPQPPLPPLFTTTAVTSTSKHNHHSTKNQNVYQDGVKLQLFR
ncbi:hypothetical protein Hanom_Chr15g01351001 [Helianthus anomalus]